MSVKVVTFFSVLMGYARKQAEAEKSGDPEAIAKARAELEAYRKLCLEADEMRIPNPDVRRVQ